MKRNSLPLVIVVLLLSVTTFFVSAQVTTLQGVVSYHNDGIRVLPNVSVLLYDESGNIYASATTDQNGFYQIPGLPNGTYTLTGTYNSVAGGISVASALYILGYLNGQEELTDMQKLAADVNGDGLVTYDDYNEIMAHYLVYGLPFPAGEWKFETKTIDIDDFKTGVKTGNIGGTSTGDTGGAFEPEISNSPVFYFASEYPYQAKDDEIVTISVKVKSRSELAAMRMLIDYPGHLLEILDVESTLDELYTDIRDNQLILSSSNPSLLNNVYHNGDEILRIKARTSKNFTKNDKIQLTLANGSHFVDGNMLKFITPDINLPTIEFTSEKSALLANFPNPFSMQTKINYRIGSSSLVNISLYSLDGRLVQTLVNDFQHEGIYQIDLLRGNLTPGNYLIKLNTSGLNPVNDTRVIILTSH